MINDNLEIKSAEGMPKLVDATIALDFLLAAKNGVRNCAIALSEAATSEVRMALRSQLENALNMHEEISKLMISKGWLDPHNLNEQFQMDIESAKTAIQIAKIELFTGDTSRLGEFAASEK